MGLVPAEFLFRVAYPCVHVEGELFDLPESCRLDFLGDMDSKKPFAEVRVGWNELGLGIWCEVKGKQQSPQGDVARPRQSDGLTVWIDTRDARASHRAGRYCHQFHLLPAAVADGEEPAFTQSKIHRALHDAPLASPDAVPFRSRRQRGGYVVEAFLPAAVLHGFDPEQNRKLGFFYAVHDHERGEQTLALDSDFPFAEDPSLWSVLELMS
jgi:hypothetical protein